MMRVLDFHLISHFFSWIHLPILADVVDSQMFKETTPGLQNGVREFWAHVWPVHHFTWTICLCYCIILSEPPDQTGISGLGGPGLCHAQGAVFSVSSLTSPRTTPCPCHPPCGLGFFLGILQYCMWTRSRWSGARGKWTYTTFLIPENEIRKATHLFDSRKRPLSHSLVRHPRFQG